MTALRIRVAEKADIAPLDALLARSYPRLLAADYPPSVLVTAIPRIAQAQPALVTCGTYFVAFQGPTLVGGGGWTQQVPGGAGPARARVGHIRHFATDVKATRSGVGRALMDRVLATARRSGIQQMECMSTRTAVPFYQNAGFALGEEVDIPLSPGITFPALRMSRRLDA